MAKTALELRFPPMALAALTAFAMWGVVLVDATDRSWTLGRGVVSLLIAVVGLAFVLSGALAFRRAQTTFNPRQPETSSLLVSSGIYAATRNPMYVGFVLVLVAWAVFLSSSWALIGPVAFVLYIARFQIVPEERVLSEKFGADYLAYRAKVPRWIGIRSLRCGGYS